MKATCDHCRARNETVRRCYRLNPRNLHPNYRLLCVPCRKKLVFTADDPGNTYQLPAGNTGDRQRR